MKINQLIRALEDVREQAGADVEVEVWLPGSRITLSYPFFAKGVALIEGNVKEGSALDALVLGEE